MLFQTLVIAEFDSNRKQAEDTLSFIAFQNENGNVLNNRSLNTDNTTLKNELVYVEIAAELRSHSFSFHNYCTKYAHNYILDVCDPAVKD